MCSSSTPIFYFNCELFFVYIVKQKQNKILWILWILKNQILLDTKFENSIIHKPFLGSREVPQQNWVWSVQRCWLLLNTNRQTKKYKNKEKSNNKHSWNLKGWNLLIVKNLLVNLILNKKSIDYSHSYLVSMASLVVLINSWTGIIILKHIHCSVFTFFKIKFYSLNHLIEKLRYIHIRF